MELEEVIGGGFDEDVSILVEWADKL